MSFWEKFNEISNRAVIAAGNTISEYKSKYDRYLELYQDYDDRRLIEKFKESNGVERAACYKLLKERGIIRENE